MKLIGIITDKDIGSDSPMAKKDSWRVRAAVRLIVFDSNNRVALMYSGKENYYKLPGGGIDEGEDPKQAALRETLEETGCSIKVEAELGRIDEHRGSGFNSPYIQLNYCFIAKVIDKKSSPSLTDSEIENQFGLVWADNIKEAIAKIEANPYNPSDIGSIFMKVRELKILKAAKDYTL